MWRAILLVSGWRVGGVRSCAFSYGPRDRFVGWSGELHVRRLAVRGVESEDLCASRRERDPMSGPGAMRLGVGGWWLVVHAVPNITRCSGLLSA